MTFFRIRRRSLLGIMTLMVVMLMACAVLERIVSSWPLETLILGTVLFIAGAGIVLYIGNLTVLGWIVDFLMGIGMPRFRGTPVPLEYDQVGEILVVTLRENIATARQCLFVEKQLKDLIHEHHCNLVLDFRHAERISTGFRQVIVHITKAARREAKKLGRPQRPVALPSGAEFPVFGDREEAIATMSKHDGHGWVALCSVPAGIRAISEVV